MKQRPAALFGKVSPVGPRQVIAFAQAQLGVEPYRPWCRQPHSIALRHPENSKWFALLMETLPQQLGLDGVSPLPTLTLRVGKDMVPDLVGKQGVYPALRFDKGAWVTVLLGEGCPEDSVCRLLQEAFSRAVPQSFASSAAVRKSMKGNTCKDTKPELVVRGLLRELGYTGYRLQWRKCPGRPDVAFPSRRIAIYVNGCFWHRHQGCRHATNPKTNVEYWEEKFARNVQRDQRNYTAAAQQGWKTVVVWECQLKGDKLQETRDLLLDVLKSSEEDQT